MDWPQGKGKFDYGKGGKGMGPPDFGRGAGGPPREKGGWGCVPSLPQQPNGGFYFIALLAVRFS